MSGTAAAPHIRRDRLRSDIASMPEPVAAISPVTGDGWAVVRLQGAIGFGLQVCLYESATTLSTKLAEYGLGTEFR